jgi:mannose-1-phosphate guanylyltransferase
MRPRIQKHPTLVASTTSDETIQDLCRFNRKQPHKEKTIKSYILMCFGIKKTITKLEYDYYISQGLTNLVRVEYV